MRKELRDAISKFAQRIGLGWRTQLRKFRGGFGDDDAILADGAALSMKTLHELPVALPFIRRLVVVSTAHLPPDIEKSFLDVDSWAHALLYARTESGWQLLVPNGSEPDDVQLYLTDETSTCRIPDGIQSIFRFAMSHGAHRIEFDADGDKIQGCTTWSWE